MGADRPNILLITGDEQCWNSLGVINDRIRTPSLDRLAHAGMRFERAYCNNPVCSPSRSTIITGLYLHSGSGPWLSEEEFRAMLGLFVDHLNAGKVDGVRIFCACQLEQKPEYAGWATEVLKGMKPGDR